MIIQRLDPSAMDTKKTYNNQHNLVNEHPEQNQVGPVTNSHPNTAQQSLRPTQHKPIQNKACSPMIYNQSKDQYQNSNVQYMNKNWEPAQVDNKKRINSNSQHRFPSSKRPPEAMVTMQGWLHKQGSDGLKVWRKRWFVLSDYCLFYYKGPEEEKVLGSILLPSYKVSLCSPDSKVGRKFAFKCEHVNMRTYYLAADSHEIMTEWVEALNMACMLQSNVDIDHQSGPSVSSMYNASLDNSDSGFHQQYPHAHAPHTYPKHQAHTHPSHSPANFCATLQPLYANAPPKPRRQNDGGYSSPSQDYSHEIYSTPPSSNNTLAYQNNPVPHYNVALQHSCSRLPGNVMYRNCDNVPLPQYVNHNQIQNQKIHSIYHPQHPHVENNIIQNNERRTPDTYGRSKLNTGKSKDASDYEDIYSDEVMYKRPLSPVAYSNIKKISPVATIPVQPVHRPYTLFANAGPHKQNFIPNNNMHIPINRQPDKILPNVVPRPHSADFLEFEMKQRNSDNLVPVNLQQPRPKSSLDISQADSDNYYYSKERYADKMRKSSVYLQHYPAHRYMKPSESTMRINRPNMKINIIPKSNTQQFVTKDMNETQPIMRDGSTPDICPVAHHKQPVCQNQEEYESLHCRRNVVDNQGREYNVHYNREANVSWNERPAHGDQMSVNREGERRREESMKRLLEWKQRMLQSPLNRKLPSLVNRTDMYKQYPTMPHIRQTQYNSYSSDDEASGSVSLATHETFPRDISKRIPPPHHHGYYLSGSHDGECFAPPPHIIQENQNLVGSHYDINEANHYNMARKGRQWTENDRMNMSAGELLGRTHEELVLLLIQLRRQSTNACHAIEACYQEIDNIQLQLGGMDAQRRMENLKKLEQLKQHLLELEKEYEKGKPLVNLVDNMVKLGSLYRGPGDHSIGSYVRDRLEFNQQIQEKRLLAEERRDWNRLSPNHMKLQAKVQQLYQLDKLLQEESETLQGLQHDKEKIERALCNLRYRLNLSQHNPKELEQARKQQFLLEKELSKVHHMLAHNSKKLEETVAGNARLEQELLVLRQKLQMSKQHRNSPQFSNAGDSLPCAAGTSAMLENELHRVQQLVGDLQRQRQELSVQVRQLTDRSHTLTQQIYLPSTSPLQSMHSANCANNKKRSQTYWRETDLDTMQIVDHGADVDNQSKSRPTTPMYVEEKNNENCQYYVRPAGQDYHQNQNEDNQLGSNLQEKQEIKTVRIVKRESERRQRDREKIGSYSGVGETQQKWESLLEEVDQSTNPFHEAPTQDNNTTKNNATNDSMLNYFLPVDNNNTSMDKETSASSPSLPLQLKSYKSNTTSNNSINLDKSPVLSPVFKSKAARQIINEMSGQQSEDHKVKCSVRRLIPKEKRRHYTAPHNSLIKSMNQIASDDDMFSGLENGRRRARDDLDMERALRQRTDTPDVVRSTLSNKELKYNENTIENLLGTPNKINIPERYIPEKLPQLSPEEQQHRLRKVESIKKMLTDTTILRSVSTSTLPRSTDQSDKSDQNNGTKVTSKIVEEKRQREHLLQLNQILAKQVMEMSKIVAVKALATLPFESQRASVEEDDLSPVTPLPLYQQRDNFYS